MDDQSLPRNELQCLMGPTIGLLVSFENVDHFRAVAIKHEEIEEYFLVYCTLTSTFLSLCVYLLLLWLAVRKVMLHKKIFALHKICFTLPLTYLCLTHSIQLWQRYARTILQRVRIDENVIR